MSRTSRVVLLLLLGFALLAGGTWILVRRAQSQAVSEALEEQGLGHEEHLLEVIRDLEPECQSLAELGERLVTFANSHPALLDLVVVDRQKRIVDRVTKEGNAMPCVRAAPLAKAMTAVHAVQHAETDVACRSLPVTVANKTGMVLFHTERDWLMGGKRVEHWVQQTAFRVAPAFLLSYLLLGLMLVLASRQVRRWRARAESAARVEALGAIAAGIDHEIKNPLNTVGLSLQFLRRKHEDAESRQVVDSAHREARRISETLKTFVQFTRVSDIKAAPASLGDLVRSAASRTETDVVVRGDASGPVDAQKIGDALADVLAVFGDAKQRLDVRFSESRKGWRVVVLGQRPAFDVERLFDPYLRTKPRDIGRGLALARAIFQAHGGDLVAHARGNQLCVRASATKLAARYES